MRQVVLLINKEALVEAEINRLQQRDEQKRDQMQRVEPREAKHEEFPPPDGSIGDRVAVLPEEDEAADAPEDPYAIGARIVEGMQEAIKRQAFLHETDRLVGDKAKVAIVEDQNRERSQEAQRLQSQQFIRRFGSRLQRGLHIADTPFKMASSQAAYPAAFKWTPSIVWGLIIGGNAMKVAPLFAAKAGSAALRSLIPFIASAWISAVTRP